MTPTILRPFVGLARFRWTATSPIAHVLGALRGAQELREAFRDHPRPQAMIHRCLHEHLAEDPWRQWLFFDYLPAHGDLDSVMVRLRWMAADLPPFVILALLRYVANRYRLPVA